MLSMSVSISMICRSEHQEQIAFVNWFRLNFPTFIIFAIPNGGVRDIGTAIKLQKEGALSGVSDLCILIPNGKVLFLEMKTETGKLSKSQKEFFKNLDLMGFDYLVGYGAKDASFKFLEYIKKKYII